MKIDITQQYTNGDDTPALDFETKKPITLKTILLQVCLHEGTKPEDKVKRWNIYRSLKKSTVDFVTLEAEEVALLKKAVTETHSVLVVGQTHEMLEKPYEAPNPEAPAKGPQHYDEGNPRPKARAPKRDPDDYKDYVE